MKKCFCLLNCIFFISIFLFISVNVVSCSKQGVRESVSIALDSPKSDTYTQAEALFKEKKFDDVIKLLSGPAYAEPNNFKLNILLAKAQVEKCALLKAQGDKSFKTLIHVPYKTGLRLHKIDETNPEVYYIVAKSLFINNKSWKAVRTIKKALYFSPNNADYLLFLGDGCCVLAKEARESYQAIRLFSKAKDAYEKALKMRKDDEEFKSKVEKRIKELKELSKK